jgi:dihydrofolate synthase/folylpolyglutamate synthase
MSGPGEDRFAALFERRAAGMRLGLEVVQPVYEALGRPGHDKPAVHIVGTNGKGSTAALCAHALTRRGHRTGLYTSPHLQQVGERVRVDGQARSDEALHDDVARVLAVEAQLVLPRALTFFEVLTLAAMTAFAAEDCAVIVAEAGLGGRLDATRIVDAHAVGVAAIDLDHVELLGPTVADIAREKAAVFRAGVPAFSVAQSDAVAAVLAEAAAHSSCSLTYVLPLLRAPKGLPGAHQRHNAALALALARVIDPRVEPEDFDDATWPGRLERIAWAGGEVVLDAAHNPAGARALAAAWQQLGWPLDAIVMGCLADKDARGIVEAVATIGVPICWVPAADTGAAAAPLHPAILEHAPDVIAALRAHAGQRVLVCGSLRLLGAARAHLFALPAPDPQDR